MGGGKKASDTVLFTIALSKVCAENAPAFDVRDTNLVPEEIGKFYWEAGVTIDANPMSVMASEMALISNATARSDFQPINESMSAKRKSGVTGIVVGGAKVGKSRGMDFYQNKVLPLKVALVNEEVQSHESLANPESGSYGETQLRILEEEHGSLVEGSRRKKIQEEILVRDGEGLLIEPELKSWADTLNQGCEGDACRTIIDVYEPSIKAKGFSTARSCVGRVERNRSVLVGACTASGLGFLFRGSSAGMLSRCPILLAGRKKRDIRRENREVKPRNEQDLARLEAYRLKEIQMAHKTIETDDGSGRKWREDGSFPVYRLEKSEKLDYEYENGQTSFISDASTIVYPDHWLDEDGKILPHLIKAEEIYQDHQIRLEKILDSLAEHRRDAVCRVEEIMNGLICVWSERLNALQEITVFGEGSIDVATSTICGSEVTRCAGNFVTLILETALKLQVVFLSNLGYTDEEVKTVNKSVNAQLRLKCHILKSHASNSRELNAEISKKSYGRSKNLNISVPPREYILNSIRNLIKMKLFSEVPFEREAQVGAGGDRQTVVGYKRNLTTEVGQEYESKIEAVFAMFTPTMISAETYDQSVLQQRGASVDLGLSEQLDAFAF